MKSSLLRSALIALAIVVVLFVLKFLLMAIFGGGGFEPPTDSVNASKAFIREWRTKITSSGTITPELGVTVRAEEAGLVEEILFESGQNVKVGEVLARLDRSVELAELVGAEAELKNATAQYSRAKYLLNTKSISKSEFDLAQSSARAAASKVDSLKAKIERKEIRALFSGRAGRRLVSKGEYLSIGQPIVELHSEDLFYVDFSVPQRFVNLLKVGLPLEITSDVWSGVVSGVIQSVNPNIEPQTRQVSVRGIVQTGGKAGLFVGVTVITEEGEDFVTIPTSSVSFAPFGDSVYVLEDEKNGIYTAKQKAVRLGQREGDQIAVISGINEGELVVNSGAFKLIPNGKVSVSQSASPTSEQNPKVKNS